MSNDKGLNELGNGFGLPRVEGAMMRNADPSYIQAGAVHVNKSTRPDDALNELEKAQAYTADRLSLLADRLHRVLDQNERPTAEPSGLATSCPLHTLLNERIYKQASINAVLDEILERLAL